MVELALCRSIVAFGSEHGVDRRPAGWMRQTTPELPFVEDRSWPIAGLSTEFDHLSLAIARVRNETCKVDDVGDGFARVR
jgi:hypothetical protein